MNYMTTKQASEKWGISEKTVINYCKKGLIKDARYTGAWFIPESAKKPALKRGRKKAYKFTFVDLFCGIGGFHQAMASLGGKCVFACDINELCRKVYAENYKTDDDELIIAADIKKVAKENNLPQFDVLCGGFPCQTFSKAGKQNGFKVVENENGETDDRGQLFFRIIDILQNHPECNYVVLENVRNLADKENDWQVVCDELKKLGFVITEEPIIESPHNFGIPQVRERVYILGIKESAIKTDVLRESKKIAREMLHIDAHYRACPDNCIPMLLDAVADERYYVPDEIAEVLEIWEEFLQNVDEVKSPFWLHKAGLGIYDDDEYKANPEIGYASMPDWKKIMVWKSRVMYNNNHEFIDDWAERHNMTKRSLIHQKFEWNASRDCTTIREGITQFRQSGVRVKNPDYFPSLVAMNNTPIVWDENAQRYRYLSPHEAAKLQSFKEGFIFNESDSVSYRQLGNSVNVRILQILCRELFRVNNETFKEKDNG